MPTDASSIADIIATLRSWPAGSALDLACFVHRLEARLAALESRTTAQPDATEGGIAELGRTLAMLDEERRQHGLTEAARVGLAAGLDAAHETVGLLTRERDNARAERDALLGQLVAVGLHLGMAGPDDGDDREWHLFGERVAEAVGVAIAERDRLRAGREAPSPNADAAGTGTMEAKFAHGDRVAHDLVRERPVGRSAGRAVPSRADEPAAPRIPRPDPERGRVPLPDRRCPVSAREANRCPHCHREAATDEDFEHAADVPRDECRSRCAEICWWFRGHECRAVASRGGKTDA